MGVLLTQGKGLFVAPLKEASPVNDVESGLLRQWDSIANWHKVAGTARNDHWILDSAPDHTEEGLDIDDFDALNESPPSIKRLIVCAGYRAVNDMPEFPERNLWTAFIASRSLASTGIYYLYVIDAGFELGPYGVGTLQTGDKLQLRTKLLNEQTWTTTFREAPYLGAQDGTVHRLQVFHAADAAGGNQSAWDGSFYNTRLNAAGSGRNYHLRLGRSNFNQ